MSGSPASWAAWLDRESAWGERGRQMVETLLPVTQRTLNAPALSLATVSNTFTSVAVLLGPAAARDVGEPLVQLCAKALVEANEFIRVNRPWFTINVLSFTNTAECSGAVSDVLGQAPAVAWLRRFSRESLDDDVAHRAALFALALGEHALAVKLAVGAKLPKRRFTPGKTFGFNVQGFVLYLANALASRAAAADIRPAWDDFVRAFPMKKAAGTLDWNDLMWAARVVLAGFEKRPVASVAQTLHELVVSL